MGCGLGERANALFWSKPASYMNRSGEPLSAIAQFYKIPNEQILVVLDDLALPLGRLRIRMDGGSGGHNGLESIFLHFATEEIAAPAHRNRCCAAGRCRRLRSWSVSSKRSDQMVEKTVERAVEAVKCAIDKGVLSAMNTFNKFSES